MKRKYKTLVCLACLQVIVFIANAQPFTIDIKKLENNFLASPTDYRQYEKLSFLISTHYLQLSIAQRKEIREFLSTHAKFSSIRILPPNEPGVPIIIKGTVKDAKGAPLKNVKLFVFHTNARGYYAPDDFANGTMNEPDARLFGYLTTDENGRYEFQTVHPGNYPKKYEGRYIPQHIHFQISHPGYQDINIQMAFDDDPSMKDRYWREWAASLKFPVIKFIKTGNATIGTCNFRLVPN